MRAALIGNRDDADPGLVGDALRERGFSFVELVRESPGDWGIDPVNVDLVVSLGSNWSTYWPEFALETSAERTFLSTGHAAGTPVLAICFGAQQVAQALGGTVSRLHNHEIGWHQVAPVSGSAPVASHHILAGQWFQWHYDGFSVPPGATAIAESTVAAQAFRVRRTLALQFHPEVTERIVRRWSTGNGATELADAGIDREELCHQTREMTDGVRKRTTALVEWFLSDVAQMHEN